MTDKPLQTALETFVKDAILYFDNNKIFEEKKFKITNYILVKKQKYSVKKSRNIDYSKVVIESWDKLKSLASVKVSKTILENRIKKLKSLQGQKILTSSAEESPDENLQDFLINYLKTSNPKKFDSKKFQNIFKNFEKYLATDLFTIFYFSPLHNFESNLSKLNIGKDVWIRNPTELEFSVISGLINGENKTIDYRLMDLNFIICTKISKTSTTNPLQLAKAKLNDSINVLKVFSSGDIELGGMYSGFSEFWVRDGPNRIEPEMHKPSSNNYELNKTHLNSFNQFLKNYQKIDFSKSKNNFIQTAIRRFGISVAHRQHDDKIVDYMICLESLFSSKSEGLIFKFANRIALILGKNNDDRINLLEFMKKSYDLRSRIVHGENPQPFSIGPRTFSLTDTSLELDTITRKAIHHFLKLINQYSDRDQIQRDMDLAIQDSRILKKIQMK